MKKQKCRFWLGLCALVMLLLGGRTQAAVTLHSPKIVKDASMNAGQKVTWDCVYFGSYPQTEIVDEESTSGVYKQEWASESDYIVNANLYRKLQNATGWDSRGDITIDGKKYRRIQSDDATYAASLTTAYKVNSLDNYFIWRTATPWHYFRYEPIKWRVLNKNGNQVLLLSDLALDIRRFNDTMTSTTWSSSTMRSWLNRDFVNAAFKTSELNAVVTSRTMNKKSLQYGTDGGEDTKDKVFLLSESEAANAAYGFLPDGTVKDEARDCRKSSTFAKAMGLYAGTGRGALGYCHWWLRSPGSSATAAATVNIGGVFGGRMITYDSLDGIRPACRMSLSAGAWKYAGTVCSDGTVNEKAGGSTSAKVTKKTQPMKVSAVTKTLKAAALKTKARTVSPLAVKSAKGTVTYKISGGTTKGKKALTINRKTGKITVKKGTKAGTYKVKVTVKAAGNSSYKSGSKTVTVTVKVK